MLSEKDEDLDYVSEVDLPPEDEAPEGFYTPPISDEVKKLILSRMRGEVTPVASDEVQNIAAESVAAAATGATISDTDFYEAELPPESEAPEGFYTAPVSDKVRELIFKRLKGEATSTTEEPVTTSLETSTSKEVSTGEAITNSDFKSSDKPKKSRKTNKQGKPADTVDTLAPANSDLVTIGDNNSNADIPPLIFNTSDEIVLGGNSSLDKIHEVPVSAVVFPASHSDVSIGYDEAVSGEETVNSISDNTTIDLADTSIASDVVKEEDVNKSKTPDTEEETTLNVAATEQDTDSLEATTSNEDYIEAELPPENEAPEGFYTPPVSDEVKKLILSRLRGETVPPANNTVSEVTAESVAAAATGINLIPPEEEPIIIEAELPPESEAPEGFYTPPVSNEVKEQLFKKIKGVIPEATVVTSINNTESSTATTSPSYDDNNSSRYVAAPSKQKKPIIYILIGVIVLILLLLMISKCNRDDNNGTRATVTAPNHVKETEARTSTEISENVTTDEEVSAEASDENTDSNTAQETPTVAIVETITQPVTEQVVTETATKATTQAATQATEPATQATQTSASQTIAFTSKATETTTKATTQATTQATTKATTQAVTQATTQATTQPTTQATTKAVPSANVTIVTNIYSDYWASYNVTITNTGTADITSYTLTVKFKDASKISSNEVWFNWNNSKKVSNNTVTYTQTLNNPLKAGESISLSISYNINGDSNAYITSNSISLN